MIIFFNFGVIRRANVSFLLFRERKRERQREREREKERKRERVPNKDRRKIFEIFVGEKIRRK